MAGPNRPGADVNIRGCGRLRSIAPTFGASEQEILQNRIARLLELNGRAVEINPTFVQVSNVIGDVECALHVVRDHYARHSQPLLQSANQALDTVPDHG